MTDAVFAVGAFHLDDIHAVVCKAVDIVSIVISA